MQHVGGACMIPRVLLDVWLYSKQSTGACLPAYMVSTPADVRKPTHPVPLLPHVDLRLAVGKWDSQQ